MFLKERLEHDLILFRNRVEKMTHEVTATSATSRKKMKETMKEEKANQDKADAQERKIKRRTKGFTEDQLNTRPSQLLSVHADCRK